MTEDHSLKCADVAHGKSDLHVAYLNQNTCLSKADCKGAAARAGNFPGAAILLEQRTRKLLLGVGERLREGLLCQRDVAPFAPHRHAQRNRHRIHFEDDSAQHCASQHRLPWQHSRVPRTRTYLSDRQPWCVCPRRTHRYRMAAAWGGRSLVSDTDMQPWPQRTTLISHGCCFVRRESALPQ